MMSIEYIQSEARRAARRSARLGVLPLVYDGQAETLRKIPFIGTRRPRGWRLVKRLFVDSSGWGSPSEPALTFEQFVGEVKVGMAYALLECGQFQVYVGEFEPPEGRE